MASEEIKLISQSILKIQESIENINNSLKQKTCQFVEKPILAPTKCIFKQIVIPENIYTKEDSNVIVKKLEGLNNEIKSSVTEMVENHEVKKDESKILKILIWAILVVTLTFLAINFNQFYRLKSYKAKMDFLYAIDSSFLKNIDSVYKAHPDSLKKLQWRIQMQQSQALKLKGKNKHNR